MTSGQRAPLSFLSKRLDRQVPWPALAWWAATLPGSAAQGGLTLWIRLVAFCARVVLCRVSAVVAVDMESFVRASPPGYSGNVDGPFSGRFVASGHREASTDDSKSSKFKCGRRRAEMKEDVVLDVVGDVDSGESSCATDGSKVGLNRENRGMGPREYGAGPASSVEDGTSKDCSEVVVVLVPTHRSYLDFVLVSLLCAAMRYAPGLSWLRVPRVAAAEGAFGSRGSLLRWVLENLGEQMTCWLVRLHVPNPPPPSALSVKNSFLCENT